MRLGDSREEEVVAVAAVDDVADLGNLPRLDPTSVAE